MGNVRKKWTDDQLKSAVAEVRGGRTISSVSQGTGIPKTTLRNKVSGKSKIGKNVGPPPILTPEDEDIIVQWMFFLSCRGFRVTKSQLLKNVAQLMKQLGRPNPFRNGLPGRHWYEGFLRRHPEISVCVAQNLTGNRASITEKN